MLVQLGIIAFVVGLTVWFLWAAWTDWRQGRAPAARSLTKLHYAKRSDTPLVFWFLTAFRFGVGVLLAWQAVVIAYQLPGAR